MKPATLFFLFYLASMPLWSTPPDSTRLPSPAVALQSQTGMTLKKLGAILEAEGQIIQQDGGTWQLVYNNRLLVVVTDENANRMRIMTPIVEVKKLKKEQYSLMLKAQFHKVLDVKYAIFSEQVWSLFAHPLKELTEEQLTDALSQVFFAAHTFGETYESTSLQFGSGDDE
ncbi:MAG: hypothetical protein AAGB22_03735 [Bacteroidota bacterium]